MSKPFSVPPEHFISEAETTVERLKQILESAAIDTELDNEGDLYVSDESFGIWIALDKEHKFIWFHTYAPLDNLNIDEGIARANALNSTIILNRFWFENGQLRADYGFYFCEGFNSRQFLRLVRRFATIFRQALTSEASERGENRTTLL